MLYKLLFGLLVIVNTPLMSMNSSVELNREIWKSLSEEINAPIKGDVLSRIVNEKKS